MSWIDRLFRRKKTDLEVARPLTNIEPAPDFGDTRTTQPKFAQGGGGTFGSLPKRSQRELGLDERSLGRYSIEDLLDILIDAHPDLSFAVWNFLRIGNSGYTVSVERLGSGKHWEQAEKEVREFIKRLSLPSVDRFEHSRSMNKLLNQLLLSVVVRGAAACELVLTPDMKDVAFIAPVDPATIEFKFEDNRYVPYQEDGKLSLDIPTFMYEGLDERVDDPYGRSPILPAINMVMFQLQILNDIKAVVHKQGYPRLDITVLEDVLLKRMPIAIRNNEEKKQEWLRDRLEEIVDMYNSLEPDDTFVHFDSIEIGMAGGQGGGALIDPEKLMHVVDNLVMNGLKTLSTIMGRRSQGQTESFAKMEIKLYLQSVKAVQEVVENLLSRALTLMLNIRGKQGLVEFKFKSLDIRTDLEKAQFEQIALQNYAFMRDQGWITQDEASRMAVGHDAVGDPVGSSIITNKDGEPVGGTVDEKGPDSPTENPDDSTSTGG